jgi:hypothetical protein
MEQRRIATSHSAYNIRSYHFDESQSANQSYIDFNSYIRRGTPSIIPSAKGHQDNFTTGVKGNKNSEDENSVNSKYDERNHRTIELNRNSEIIDETQQTTQQSPITVGKNYSISNNFSLKK